MSRTGLPLWRLLACVVTLVLASTTQAQTSPGEPAVGRSGDPEGAPARPAIAGRRIVKHFDFNEQPLGNYDPIPMHWRRHGETGFPQYLEGKFDPQVGHAAAPSFRLDLDGGSLAYHYQGRDIAVRTNSDYLVVAWGRTDSLESARAYLTTYYLDRRGTKIAGTERCSRLLGGPGTPTDWCPLTVGLPGNLPGSRYIGITLWLTQSSVWDAGPKALRHIEREDVKATAWFDDITVYRLPRVSLQTAHPGNVFGEDDAVELQTEVSDPDGLNLSAKLVIRSSDGRVIDTRPVSVESTGGAGFDRVIYDDLAVGLYHAELIVSTAGTALVRRSLRFARVADTVSSPADTGRGFGVRLSDITPNALPGQRELLRQLRAEYVTIPVWYAQRAVTGRASGTETVDRYLEAIVQAHGDPIAILADDPATGNGAGSAGVRTMVEILSEDPLAWKPLIAGLWSRYAGLIHVWQVGSDGDDSVFLDHRLGGLIPILRREMRPLMSQPLLATPASANYAPLPKPISDYDALTLPARVPPDEAGGHIRPFLGDDPRRIWVVVEPLDQASYPRELRLADLSRRLVEAFYQKVGGVFLAAPWDVRQDLLHAQVSPREDFIVLRTIADLLGGSTPVLRVTIDGQAECLVFDRNNRAILFVWDRYAPAEGREHVLFLGEQVQQIDLWGRCAPLSNAGKRQIVRIGPMPTFIVNTSTWLMEFRRAFQLEPSLLEASFEAGEQYVVFRNTYHEPISGLLRLFAPENWEVRPNRISFSLRPGEQFRRPIAVHFPHNVEAGVKALVGEFVIDASQRYQLVSPAWFEIGLHNIDLDTYVFRTGDRVIVRQSITNRADQGTCFEGYVIAPRRPRLNRLFANFLPGQNITKDFILEDAADLAGARVRVGLKELQGSRVWNRTLTVP